MNRLPVALAGALLAAAALAQTTVAPSAPHPATPPHPTSASPHGPAPVGAPHGMRSTTTAGTSMGALTPSDATRQMLTCRIGELGNVPVLVNFAERTALSTRASAISPATIEGDVVRWQEKEPGGASKYTLNRRSGEIQVAVRGAGGKDVVHRGTCGPATPRR